jgi:endoglycosylceramidase
VEPVPGQFDDAYLAHIAETVNILAGHGILSLIDFHQDEYGPVFHDNGYPAWMTMTDGLSNAYQVGFPFQYLANPALERAFDHLWANSIGSDGKPLQTDDAAILAHVARALNGLPGLLGYEILNEPWPGSSYPTCIEPIVGCPLFDTGPLSAYYDRMIGALRGADHSHLIWYEPLVLFNYGIPTHVVPPADRELGFAFHDYSLCSGTPLPPHCGTEDSLVLSNAVSYSKSAGVGLLETEFGATTNPVPLTQQVNQYDKSMVPWLFWSYAEIDPTGPGDTFGPPAAAKVNHAVLAALVRPYPQVVSGTPIAWSFDPTTKAFTFQYSPARADKSGTFPAGSETDVFVPAIQYPHGYRVTVTGGTVTSAPGAPVVRIGGLGDAGVVSVAIGPVAGAR